MSTAFNRLALEVLKAERAVHDADIEALRLVNVILTHPHSEIPQRYVEVVQRVAGNCEREFRIKKKGYVLQIERACYGWRREFGEWPTRFNLADRLASETGVSRKRAERLIFQSINNPGDGCRVHCIRGSLLAEILTGTEDLLVLEPWSATGETDLRFYVLAGEAQELPSIEWWTKSYLEATA